MSDSTPKQTGAAGILLLIEMKRYSAARDTLGEQLRQRPDDPELLYAAALLELRQKNSDEAERLLSQLLAHKPRDRAARWLLFTLREGQKRYGEAEQIILALLADYPEEPDYYAAYGWLMLLTLHAAKSEKLAREALRLDASHSSALFTLVCAQIVLYRRYDAEISLQKLLRENPDSELSLTALIIVLNENCRYREALQISQELVRARPTLHNVDLAIQLRVITHPLLAVTRPLYRFGWMGSAVFWILSVVLVQISLRQFSDSTTLILGTVIFGYCVYSWVVPYLLKHWIKWRGI